MQRVIANVAKYGLVIGAIAYMLSSGMLSGEHLAIRSDGYRHVSLAVLALLCSMLMSFARYWFLARGAGLRLSLMDCVRYGFVGAFFNSFLLGSVGGDMIKLVCVARDTGKRAAALSSIIVDRMTGMMGLFVAGAIAFSLSWATIRSSSQLQALATYVLWLVGTAAFAALVGMVAMLRGRRIAAFVWAAGILSAVAVVAVATPGDARSWNAAVGATMTALLALLVLPSLLPGRTLESWLRERGDWGERITGLISSFLIYRHNPGLLVGAVAASVCSQALGLAGLWLVGHALPIAHPPSLQSVLLAGPASLLANTLPVPGGGLGVGEVAFDRLLGLVTGSHGIGGAAMFLMFRLLNVLCGLPGVPFYLADRSRYRVLREQAALARS